MSNGYPWAMSVALSELVSELNVRTQSTKFGIGADGVIRFRKGYGTNSADAWRGFLDAIIH